MSGMKFKHWLMCGLLAATLVTPVVVSNTTFALLQNSKDQVCQGLGGCDANPEKGINTLIANIINLISIIIGIIAVVMVIFGGFKYITSGGDSSKATSARSTIIAALVGLVIVVLAQFIVQFVLNRVTTTPKCSGDAVKQANGSFKEPGGAICKN